MSTCSSRDLEMLGLMGAGFIALCYSIAAPCAVARLQICHAIDDGIEWDVFQSLGTENTAYLVNRLAPLPQLDAPIASFNSLTGFDFGTALYVLDKGAEFRHQLPVAGIVKKHAWHCWGKPLQNTHE